MMQKTGEGRRGDTRMTQTPTTEQLTTAVAMLRVMSNDDSPISSPEDRLALRGVAAWLEGRIVLNRIGQHYAEKDRELPNEES